MACSVIVPTYNRQATLRQTLAALATQVDADYEVIVVDDGSMDGTSEIVAHAFPTVRLIRQPNRGPAAARNHGIQESTGEIIAFTDDDCVPPADWLARICDGYARYPEVAGVGGYLEPPRAILNDNIFARYEQYVARSLYGVADHEVVGGFECPAGGTNNMSYRRTILEQIGGFDETFPYAAGEDADLKWRICQTGAQLLYIPVRVEHLHAYTRSVFKRQAYFRGKGRARFEAKHGSQPTRVRIALRLIRRWMNFPLDMLDTERRPYATLRIAEAWWNSRGEWDMTAELRTWTSST